MLNTGQYTCRHNNLINFIVKNVDKKNYFIRNLPGLETIGGRIIPVDLCVINLKPDIDIIDSQKKQLNIFELTCPLISNIEKLNLEKSKEYAPFVRDIN